MLTQICLTTITVLLIVLTLVLIRAFSQILGLIRILQTDVQTFFFDTTKVLTSLDDFVRNDLHGLSQETTQLVGSLNNISSNLKDKTHSLDFLFKPLSMINAKLTDSSSGEKTPQVMKWLATGAVLFKITKELIQKYGRK